MVKNGMIMFNIAIDNLTVTQTILINGSDIIISI